MSKDAPVVMISSTSEDLREFRAAARDAAIREGFLPRMMEYAVAEQRRKGGGKSSLHCCII